VELVVVDNGPGTTQENLTKVLEPLFTTKNFGTGLGLPAVENILVQHGGGLDIVSREGEGATFTAWFPVEPSPPEFKNAA
jgi:two-component system sensor histidine kinase HydH